MIGRLEDLPRLAAGSDVLVIAAPHTTETAGAVDRSVLERLPLHGLVINVSRDHCSMSSAARVDRSTAAARSGARRIRGRAVARRAPVLAACRVLVSPHVSAVTTGFWDRETALIVDNIQRYLAGAPLTNVVDLEAGY